MKSGRKKGLAALAGLLVVGLAVLTGWYLRSANEPDWLAVQRANLRGVGLMERFDYPGAAEAFEEVLRLAPSWPPGRVNLGIALLNQHEDPANLDRALGLFAEVLKTDPGDAHAHYCTGIILLYRNKAEEAVPAFRAVTRIDPNDAYAWFNLGKCLAPDPADMPEEAVRCFDRAAQLDPAMSAALYQQAMRLRFTDPKAAQDLLNVQEKLRENVWDNKTELKYTSMGRYAEVIGLPPRNLAAPEPADWPRFTPGALAAAPPAPGSHAVSVEGTLGNPAAELQNRVRLRFGTTVVAFDADRDGKPDLLLLGAGLVDGKLRDLFLHNEGIGRFKDDTARAGLGQGRVSLGCAVGDFDNDGYPDLFLTGAGWHALFRNRRDGTFEDVTAAAGLGQPGGVALGAAWVDLDQDGDLDLVAAQFAAAPEDALALFGDPRANVARPVGQMGLAVYLNVGEAPPHRPNEDPAPLTPRFRRAAAPAELLGDPVPTVNVLVSDLDGDRDLDLLTFADGPAPHQILNDRLLRFRRRPVGNNLLPPGIWNGGLVLAVNPESGTDLVVLGLGQAPRLFRHRAGQGVQAVEVNAPPLLQAHAFDGDLDGARDVVGITEGKKLIVLRNRGGKLAPESSYIPEVAQDLSGLAVADFNEDGRPDLVTWSPTAGLGLYLNAGNGNHGIKLEATGHRRADGNNVLRTNADGVGVTVLVQTAGHGTGAENTTLSAGLGQSRLPLILGLGRYEEADVVRLRWPDNAVQAVLNLPGGGTVHRIDETNRKPGSCPVLFTWDGQRFAFVTDFLGAGSVGEMGPDGGTRPPRPEESVKIESHQLMPRDGRYVLKIQEPMSEITYLDKLRLLVLDHPADVRVYPDERFATAGPPPSQDLLAFREEIYPAKATDHRGRDVTAVLRRWDRDTVRDFLHRSWVGLAEEHAVTLDFGDRLARFGPTDRLTLFLAGWTDYAYPESIWAAHQAGVPLQPPVLERLGDDGRWHTVLADPGFPAGLPRMMTVDVTGLLPGPRCVLRLRTNMTVYWDQVFVAPLVETTPSVRVTPLEVSAATLSARACAQEYTPDGRQPTLYDHDRTDPTPVVRPSGRLTRFGDVTALLREADDRFTLFGPGDEVTAAFDAARLPELPPGWARSYVLRTWGYCKDTAPFTATGDRVEPLPFRGMTKYPYGPEERHPHPDYDRAHNTRRTGTR